MHVGCMSTVRHGMDIYIYSRCWGRGRILCGLDSLGKNEWWSVF